MNTNNLTHKLSNTWDTISQGWNNLISRASNALTQFISNKDKDENLPVTGSRWGLISADVYDDADKVIVKVEIPGLDNDDFDITIVDNVLTISGEKQFQRESKDGKYSVFECAYGQFSRSIPLEYEVDADTAKASYNKGILKLELQKKAHQRRRKIEIKQCIIIFTVVNINCGKLTIKPVAVY